MIRTARARGAEMRFVDPTTYLSLTVEAPIACVHAQAWMVVARG
jgi:hypothetical protein